MRGVDQHADPDREVRHAAVAVAAVLSAEFRDQRMMRAEEKAARLPATLTVPMILFILPTLFIVLVGPAMIDVYDRSRNERAGCSGHRRHASAPVGRATAGACTCADRRRRGLQLCRLVRGRFGIEAWDVAKGMDGRRAGHARCGLPRYPRMFPGRSARPLRFPPARAPALRRPQRPTGAATRMAAAPASCVMRAT